MAFAGVYFYIAIRNKTGGHMVRYFITNKKEKMYIGNKQSEARRGTPDFNRARLYRRKSDAACSFKRKNLNPDEWTIGSVKIEEPLPFLSLQNETVFDFKNIVEFFRISYAADLSGNPESKYPISVDVPGEISKHAPKIWGALHNGDKIVLSEAFVGTFAPAASMYAREILRYFGGIKDGALVCLIRVDWYEGKGRCYYV
jgi:hypothetical protein